MDTINSAEAHMVFSPTNPFEQLRSTAREIPSPLFGGRSTPRSISLWEDERALLCCLREGATGHATTVRPLLQNFDEHGWVGGAWRTMLDKRNMRASAPKGTRAYVWVLLRPEAEALSEMARLVELGRLSLPIGIRAPLRDARSAFDHMRRRLPARDLIIA